MSWLLPSALAIGGVAALVTLALHFIARSRPIAEPLPTARFIPQQPVHARSRSIALSDVALLVLRAAALVILAAGAAGPLLSSRGRVTRIVVADRSRSVANIGDVRDSARAYLRAAGDQLIVFDSSVARAPGQSDSIVATTARGSLSAGLAAATRAAVFASSRTDSIEVVLVSPMSEEEMDDATLEIRKSYPGHLRLVNVRAAQSASGVSRVEINSGSDDAVAAGLSLMGVTSNVGAVRVVRGRPSAADSAWARIAGHTLVLWPDRAANTTDATNPGFARRAVVDTIGGVASNSGALVAGFPRLWTLDGTAVARWADGELAAVEHALGDGCVRDVGILIDPASDLTLHAPFRGFVAALLAPCGGARNSTPIAASVATALAGPPGLASSTVLRDRATETSRATPWLLILGALLLILELGMRRSTRRHV